MSDYKKSKKVEAEGSTVIYNFIKKYYKNVVSLHTKDLQRYGDYIAQKEGKTVIIEVKNEEKNKYGNFFIETWSNRKWSNMGWIHKLKADVLLYYFQDTGELFVFNPVQDMVKFLIEDGNIWKYPQAPQKKYCQQNDTWGACVPIDHLTKFEWCKKLKLETLTTTSE